MAVDALLHDMADDLERGIVPLSIYGDPEIWNLELIRIFARCWIFVGHESEIPEPGDYMARAIADTPVIVTRDASGEIHVLLDSCRHRGAKLCRRPKGNTSQFSCAYHGWTYRSDGTLIGVPNRAEGYGNVLRTEDWGLLRARVGTYLGLIFACIDLDGPSLEEYLGDFRWYLDIQFGLSPEGLEVLGSPLRWVQGGNWKSVSENIAGDSYHLQTLHRSVELNEAGQMPLGGMRHSLHVTDCGGHAAGLTTLEPGKVSYWGRGADYERFYRNSNLSPAQLEVARRSLVGVGCVFPNFGWGHAGPAIEANGKTASSQFFVWALQPRSSTSVEVWKWFLVPKGLNAAEKERSYELMAANHGPAGLVDQDDTSVFSGIAFAGASTMARLRGATLNYTMGDPEFTDVRVVTDWPGPGRILDSRLEDGVQKTILRHWLELMRRG